MKHQPSGLLTCVLLLSTLMGGCVGGSPQNLGPSESSPDATTTTSSGTMTASASAGATENTAPTISLTAGVSNGTAPINITFEFDATDAEGDALRWTLDADGDDEDDASGDALPANYTHLFAAAGVFVATLEVSDGVHVANHTLPITVTASAAFEDLTFTGTLSGIWVGDLLVTGTGAYLPPEGGDNHTFDLASSPTQITLTLTWDGDSGYDMDMNVFAPDGTRVGRAANFNVPGDSAEEPVVIEDAAALSQTGTWTVQVLSAGSLECPYTVVVHFE